MPDKKLTDNEIVKALECCIGNGSCKELQCPMRKECDEDIDSIYKSALDLINRQNAEIERLKQIVGFTPARGSGKSPFLNMVLDNVKAEAYKECIEKVEEIICDNTYPDFDINHKAVNIWKAEAYKNIDNLLKELVGEQK